TFDPKNSLLGARLFYISNISYINNGMNYFVLHRETGHPLVKASVQVWEEKYDYRSSKYLPVKTGNYKTDDKGFFRMEKKKEASGNRTFMLDVTYGEERLFINDRMYDYYY